MTVTASLVEDRGETFIQVETQWHHKDAIKQIPGVRWHGITKTWRLPRTWPSCIQLRGVFRDELVISDDLNEWAYREQELRVNPAVRLRMQIDWSGDKTDDRLYDFQQCGVQFLITAGNSLLADEMGTGKTIQLLAALRDQHGNQDVLPALVISPNGVKANWAKETATWFPEATAYPLLGSSAQRLKTLKQALSDPSAIVIVNIEAVRMFSRLAPYGSIRLERCRECDPTNGAEGLSTSRCHTHPKPLNTFGFKTVIVDEAHRIKDPKSQQTRAIWAVGQGETVKHRYAATGTPIANAPDDLWSIMHFVEPKEYPTKSTFVDRYCLQAWNNFGGLDVVGIRAETKDEFYRFFDPRFRRMPKALVLPQLPPKVRSVRWVDLSAKQRKAYEEMKAGFTAMLGDDMLTVFDDLHARTRLMQLASSFARIDKHNSTDPHDWTVELIDPSPKVDELLVVHEELGDQSYVVSAESRRLIELASERYKKLGIDHVLITGAIGEWERARNLEQFQEGRVPVLMFTVKAGGTGLTMTRAGTMVCLQRSDSLIDNKQAEDRIHRIGSERHESVHIIDLVARDTVEERQILRLHEKFMRLQEITRDRATLLAAGTPTEQLDWEEQQILSMNLGNI